MCDISSDELDIIVNLTYLCVTRLFQRLTNDTQTYIRTNDSHDPVLNIFSKKYVPRDPSECTLESKTNRDLCPTRARFIRNCYTIKHKTSDRVDIINFINWYKIECQSEYIQNQRLTRCGCQTFFGVRFGVRFLRHQLRM